MLGPEPAVVHETLNVGPITVHSHHNLDDFKRLDSLSWVIVFVTLQALTSTTIVELFKDLLDFALL